MWDALAKLYLFIGLDVMQMFGTCTFPTSKQTSKISYGSSQNSASIRYYQWGEAGTQEETSAHHESVALTGRACVLRGKAGLFLSLRRKELLPFADACVKGR